VSQCLSLSLSHSLRFPPPSLSLYLHLSQSLNEEGRKLSPGTKLARTLTLNFPAPGTVRTRRFLGRMSLLQCPPMAAPVPGAHCWKALPFATKSKS
jgi:hypothetical protein